MQQIVYIASPGSQQIHVLALTPQGEINVVQVVNVGAVGQPMVLSHDQRYLYIGVRPEFAVQCYRIDSQGRLHYYGKAPLPGSPTHISLDKSGQFLFSASYNDNCLSVNPIRTNDGVILPPIQVIHHLSGCHSANMDNDNQQLYVPCLKADTITAFHWQGDGQLIRSSHDTLHSKKGAGPRHMAYHPNGKYAYCINELNSEIDVIRLTPRNNAIIASYSMLPTDFKGTCWAADIHLTSDGRYLYCCDRTTSLLTAFSISQDGQKLVLVERYVTEKQPRGFAITPDDQFIIVAGQLSNAIALYQRLTDGRLNEIAKMPVGKGPMWVTVLK